MGAHNVTKGLDLPITGQPEQSIHDGATVSSVATVAADFTGMKPRMLVRVGDEVKRGQHLFEDRKTPGVFHPALAGGRITAIHRGDYRALQSVVIELSDQEKDGSADGVSFESFDNKKVSKLERADVVKLLVESGAWTGLRTRPFSRTPGPDGEPPHAIFVTCTDSHPLSADPAEAIKGREEDFDLGLEVVAKLAPKVYCCVRKDSRFGPIPKIKGVEVEHFDGPHPAGTVGYHIHVLAPVSRKRTVWHLNYQEVAAWGRLFRTGELGVGRVVALSGPTVHKPRLLATRVGAPTETLVAGELADVENRVISGSVLSGRTAMGERTGYLGRFHNSISALREGRERELFGWLKPGTDKFSTSNTFVSSIRREQKMPFTTTTHGSKRAMVPIGMYERVFPFDILPTFLLRAIIMDDITRAEKLGILELDEEDVDLCTFVCPGKHEYGPILRRNLETIWKEG